MADLKTSNDHNVYILGAGFSVTAGLPTMAPFLNRMRDALEALQRAGRTWECQAIGEVLEYRLKAASAAYWANLDLENVEQLFSLAYAARHPVSKQLPVAMAATLDFCRQNGSDRKVRLQLHETDAARRLRPPHGAPDAKWAKEAPKLFGLIEGADREGQTTSHVAALLGMVNSDSRVSGTNTFITFNYDTLVEDALTRLEVPWTYGFESDTASEYRHEVEFMRGQPDGWGRSKDEAATPVLKLHGSVNWTIDKDNAHHPLKVFRSYDTLREAEMRPRLIPPTWSKSVEDHLALPWEQAIRRLRSATRVVVIGFSMPETDLHFRYLLAAGLQENAWLRTIVFVNPDAEAVEARARAVLRSNYVDQKLIRFARVTSDRFGAALLGNSAISAQDIRVDVGRRAAGQLGFWTPSV